MMHIYIFWGSDSNNTHTHTHTPLLEGHGCRKKAYLPYKRKHEEKRPGKIIPGQKSTAEAINRFRLICQDAYKYIYISVCVCMFICICM